MLDPEDGHNAVSETSATLCQLAWRNILISLSVTSRNFSLLVGCCWLLALCFTLIVL